MDESEDCSNSKQNKTDTFARRQTTYSIDLNEKMDFSDIDLTNVDIDLTESPSVCQISNSTIREIDAEEEEEQTEPSTFPTLDDSKLELDITEDNDGIESKHIEATNTSVVVDLSETVDDLSGIALQTNAEISESEITNTPNVFQSTAVDGSDGIAGLFSEGALSQSAIEVLGQTPENHTKTITNGLHRESDTQIAPMATYSATTESILQVDTEVVQVGKENIFNDNIYFKEAFVELGRRLWPSSMETQHFLKGCLWSPDGTCLLIPVHKDGMHLFELPQDLYTERSISKQRKLSKLKAAVHVKEGGTVYDFVWYPFMDSIAPATCCWLASRQHEPIHMWDAFTGELRCTYRGYDEVDEIESAISIIFTNDGEKVLGGYKKSIKVFETDVPGREITTVPVKQAISCFAQTTDSNTTVTTGSWNGYINHYDLRAPQLGALFTLGDHSGGITWLRYSIQHGGNSWLLYSGARKDNKILQWDMRNYTQPVREFMRTVGTNQRIYFDLSPHEQRWLVSGDTEGIVRVWDLLNNVEEELPLHSDCCNGVNFHPSYPILATTSGQFHFIDSGEDEETSAGEEGTETQTKVVNYENALKLWWIGSCMDLNDT